MSLHIPKVRPRQRSRAYTNREFPTHRAFIRKHECIVSGCRATDIQACHARDDLPPGESGGMGWKPGDWWCWPGCEAHHAEQGRIGERPFDDKYGVDMRAVAIWFADRTTDKALREFLRERRAREGQ